MPRPPARSDTTVVGLFAGIGGLELGLRRAGYVARLLCEIDPGAQAVLRARFGAVPAERAENDRFPVLVSDIRDIDRLPDADLVVAGFPCQDLSQAGRTAGISGLRSGLVDHVFDLVADADRSPRWLLLENVPFMLQLDRGEAMRHLVERLETLGFRWAYRVVDTMAFGLPQRRRRVLILASRTEDPRTVMFVDDAGPPKRDAPDGVACGFFWTEGLRGLGWAVDAVPTLKGGSTIGIPSPPAIWHPTSGRIVTPDLRDAERLQGFPQDWTAPALEVPGYRAGARWKLVGNAVSVPVARWFGTRLRDPQVCTAKEERLPVGAPWPSAACGVPDGPTQRVEVSMWPVRGRRKHLWEFLDHPVTPLSARATEGFLRRAEAGSLRFNKQFLADVAAHLEKMADKGAVA